MYRTGRYHNVLRYPQKKTRSGSCPSPSLQHNLPGPEDFSYVSVDFSLYLLRRRRRRHRHQTFIDWQQRFFFLWEPVGGTL